MRMWLGVEPEEMCSQHLLGEHNELHMLKGNLDNENFNLIEGHEKEGQVDISRLYQRHERLEREMISRGMTVNSDMERESIPDTDDNWRVSYIGNRNDLFNRCKKCRKNRRLRFYLRAGFIDLVRIERHLIEYFLQEVFGFKADLT